MIEVTKSEFDRAIAHLDVSISRVESGINSRLDTLNSRTRKLEASVAVHWILWCLLGAILLPLVPELYRFIMR